MLGWLIKIGLKFVSYETLVTTITQGIAYVLEYARKSSSPEGWEKAKSTVTKVKGWLNLFDEVYEGALFISDKILLSHEPIYGLDFCLNIHGHNHNKAEKDDELHLNLASNICRWKPVSLKDIVKQGKISKIQTIHRKTIDNATMNKIFKNFPEKF